MKKTCKYKVEIWWKSYYIVSTIYLDAFSSVHAKNKALYMTNLSRYHKLKVKKVK